jgi:hypothetical protein
MFVAFYLVFDNHFMKQLRPSGWTALRVLMPLPDNDFDPTEGKNDQNIALLTSSRLVSVPWKIMTMRGIKVFFATEKGKKPQCDVISIYL